MRGIEQSRLRPDERDFDPRFRLGDYENAKQRHLAISHADRARRRTAEKSRLDQLAGNSQRRSLVGKVDEIAQAKKRRGE